jgi:hypothetical protein
MLACTLNRKIDRQTMEFLPKNINEILCTQNNILVEITSVFTMNQGENTCLIQLLDETERGV